MNQLMSNKGDCRTAPATPGLVNMILIKINIKIGIKWIDLSEITRPFFIADKGGEAALRGLEAAQVSKEDICIRPCVAGAVLQTPL